jgi:hypothetical protein
VTILHDRKLNATIRLAKSLHVWLSKEARKSHRSLTAEIEHRLAKQKGEEEIARGKARS